MGWETRFQNNDPSYLEPRISNAESSLAENTSQLSKKPYDITTSGALIGSTQDNSTAINAAASYCRTNNRTLRIPDGQYFIKSQVDLRDLSVQMTGEIVVADDFIGTTAVLMGSTSDAAVLSNKSLEINVEKVTVNWSSNITGVELKNAFSCDIKIKKCDKFTIGFRLTAKNSTQTANIGTAWNTIIVNSCHYNQKNVLIDSQDSISFTNENTFIGGRYGWGDIGIHITRVPGGKDPNHNLFIKPDFDYSGIGLKIENGETNHVISGRFEGVTTMATFENQSDHNQIEIGHAGYAYTYTDTSASKTNRVFRIEDKLPMYSVLKDKSFAYTTMQNNTFICPSFSIRRQDTSTEISSRFLVGLTSQVNFANGVLQLSKYIAVGINVDTTYTKRLVATAYAPYPMSSDIKKRLIVIPFDVNGNRLIESGTDNWVVGGGRVLDNTAQQSWSASEFGGCYQITLHTLEGKSIARIEQGISLRDEVAYCWIGLSGQEPTPTGQAESFDILTYDRIRPKAWLGYSGTKLLQPHKYSTVLPISGSWFKDEIVYNSSPTTGNIVGWVCTTQGTANNAVWASGSSYTVGQQVNTSGNVYQCTTAGSGTSTSQPTGTVTTPTSYADGYSWEYIDVLAAFKPFGTVSVKKSGIASFSGDGASTSKTFAHSLGVSPTNYFVHASSVDAGTAGIKYYTADATNITVFFNSAIPSGTSNILLNWTAEG